MGLYRSETDKCRERLLRFCQGPGVDVGCGIVTKITQDAVGIDSRQGIADRIGQADDLKFLDDKSQAFCYSSHVLEHLRDPIAAIAEWMRVVRDGGHLVLYLPHKDHYDRYFPNPEHRWLLTQEKVKGWIEQAANTSKRSVRIVHEFLDVGDDRYSFDLVVEIGTPPRKPRVLFVPYGHDGCAYLRARYPARWLQISGLADVRVADVPNERDVQWAEVCVFQRATGALGVQAIWDLAGQLKKPRVYDTDDDIFHHPEVGGHPYYTAQEIERMRRMVSEADLVTCSTSGVEDAMSGHNSRTAMIRNGVNPEWFHTKRRDFDGKVRLGFLAAPAHDQDFALIVDAVRAILDEHPNVTMVFQGHVPAAAAMLPESRVKKSAWVEFVDLPAIVPPLGIDLLLVPWADTPFARTKSAQKWLDSAWMWAVAVVTPMSDFSALCEHDRTAVLVPGPSWWAPVLRELIADRPRRERIASAARDHVLETFGYQASIHRWADVYRTIA